MECYFLHVLRRNVALNGSVVLVIEFLVFLIICSYKVQLHIGISFLERT